MVNIALESGCGHRTKDNRTNEDLLLQQALITHCAKRGKVTENVTTPMVGDLSGPCSNASTATISFSRMEQFRKQ